MPALIKPPSVLLMGESGSGKTDVIATLIEAGLEVFIIVTEPNGLESLIDSIARRKLDINRLHYRVISPARSGFKRLLELATTVSVAGFDALSKMQPTNQRSMGRWITVLEALDSFTDDRTGQSFGDVTKLGPTCAVVVDSLSGLNLMAMDLTIGDKVTAHQGEWGVAMGLLDKLILGLTSDLSSLFVLIAHIEREQNEVTGASNVMASALGRKLAPRLPRFFSEVVLAYSDATGYHWSTDQVNTTLKHRALARASKLPATFLPIVEAWRARVAQVKTEPTAGTQP